MRSFGFVAGLLGLMMTASAALAQTSASQTVRIQFEPVSRAAVTAVPALMATRTPGVSIGTGTYRISTTEAGQKIVASLDRAMPAGASLALTMAAPRGASAHGAVLVRTAALDVVTEIQPMQASDLPIAMTMSAGHGTVEGAGQERLLTYTILVGA
jgi:hypothetical protein